MTALDDLRRRVETLEARASTEESSATEPAPAPAANQRRLYSPVQIAECGGPCSDGGPDACDCGALVESAPAPAADRPLWRVMREDWDATGAAASDATGYAAEIDAVASWLEQRYLDRYPGAAELLRAEAQRAREGA